MKFLVDQNLSLLFVDAIRAHRHDVVHTSEQGLARALDAEILDAAEASGRVIVSADTDFGTLLAVRRAAAPSVVLFRVRTPRKATGLAAALIDNLSAIEHHLEVGAIVVIEDTRLRVRLLPIG